MDAPEPCDTRAALELASRRGGSLSSETAASIPLQQALLSSGALRRHGRANCSPESVEGAVGRRPPPSSLLPQTRLLLLGEVDERLDVLLYLGPVVVQLLAVQVADRCPQLINPLHDIVVLNRLLDGALQEVEHLRR